METLRPFIIPIFLPQMGCAYHCLYCNQRSITRSTIDVLGWETFSSIVEAGLFSKRKKTGQPVEIAFFGGTFTNLPWAFQERILAWAGRYFSQNQINSIRISTRPDALSEKEMDRLWTFGVRTVELGVQSFDDRVLNLLNRGHKAQDAIQALALLKKYPIQIGIQLMAGLPGDTTEGFIETIEKTVALRPDFVRIYPTLVFRDTPLAQWWRDKRYQPLSLAEAVALCSRALERFEENGIRVIRLGLQENEGMHLGKDLLAGPFHPAFGYLVRGDLFIKKILQDLRSLKSLPSPLGLEIGPKDLSYLAGDRGKNWNRLIKESGIDTLDLNVAPGLSSGSWRWVRSFIK
jgi:histone acetyltransferase (RNA polymerase elongator complex component)